MYVLDTDTVSLFFRDANQQAPLRRRILSTPIQHLWISIITVDEQLAGVKRLIEDPRRSDEEVMSGCRLLKRVMGDLSTFHILPYDKAADQIFRNMSAASKRVGKNDCKIAAIALSRNLTVITRNVQHYAQIGQVKYEDWTREEA